MPAPVAYHDDQVDPFSHLESSQKTTSVSCFYATNRSPESNPNSIPYGNGMSNQLHLGEVNILFGDKLTTWDDLYQASTKANIQEPIQLSIASTTEIASIDTDQLNYSEELPFTPKIKKFTDAINKELSMAIDKEIIIYIHGAKGSFLKSVTLTAELDHFSGRDFIAIAFSWPSRQDIFSYLFGNDAERALHSTASLRTLIEILAKNTTATSINLISYSAGGKLASKALQEIRLNHPSLQAEELRKKFKLGTILFTAADVSVDSFLKRLPAISTLAQQVVVTVSDADNVLHFASILMTGTDRIGTREAEARENIFISEQKIKNFEIVDFSLGSEERGFDITGHHYWHRHPWASSDVVFLLRTDSPGKFRGLSPSEVEGIWYLSKKYPSQVRSAIKKELEKDW